MDDFVNQGEYRRAVELANSTLERLHVWQRDDQAVVFLAYLGKTKVELGQLGEAARVLEPAEELSSRVPDKHYDAALFREIAALQYALAEYDASAATAAKAFRLSVGDNYYRIRAGYCKGNKLLDSPG